MKNKLALLALISAFSLQPSALVLAAPLGTAFTYQGKLTAGGQPADGSYELKFTLYAVDTGGPPIAGPVTNSPVGVTNGLFAATLDFGSGVFTGDARWLEIAVRATGGGAFTSLAPRQPLTPTPYALFAPTAGTAANSASVPATGLTGTLPDARLSTNVALLNSSPAFSGPVVAPAFVGSGAGLSNLNASAIVTGILPDGRLSPDVAHLNSSPSFSGPVVAPAFVGSGGGLTNLNASRLSTGIVPEARLGTNVALLNGGADFAGPVSAPGFIGGGTGLSNLNASRLTAGLVPDARLSANVALLNSSPTFSGTVTAPAFSGVGSQPLELTVGGARAFRLEPFPGGVPNVIGGWSGNFIASGEQGATIGGGGTPSYPNSIAASSGTIGGGLNNLIQASAEKATIGGGSGNTIDAGGATISGGANNTIQADASASAIGGGNNNTIQPNAYAGTIGGGQGNTIQSDADYATIPGGGGAKASHFGQLAHASGPFTESGDAQTSIHVLRNSTSDAVATRLGLQGTAGGQQMTLAQGATWTFDILITARTTTDDSAGYQIRGVIENVGGTTSLVGALSKTVLAEDDASWDATVEADDTNDALVIKVTGATGATIRWVASVRTVEVKN